MHKILSTFQPLLIDFIKDEAPDILCLNEIKVDADASEEFRGESTTCLSFKEDTLELKTGCAH